MPATVTVLIPTALRAYTQKRDSIALKGETVADILSQLIASHSSLKKHLYSEDGKLRKFVNVYLNNDDIRYLEQEHSRVKDKDIISIIPSIAGG